jgi:hypothetical protein
MVKCMIKQIFCNTQIESVVHIFLPLLPTAYSRCENRGTSIIHQPVRATAPSLHLLTVADQVHIRNLEVTGATMGLFYYCLLDNYSGFTKV